MPIDDVRRFGYHNNAAATQPPTKFQAESTFMDQMIRIEMTQVGWGVFANRSFLRSELIVEVEGTVIEDPGYESNYCMEMTDEKTLEPAAPFRYMNHSCEPNCTIVLLEKAVGDEARTEWGLFVETLREIPRHEQLTIDYAWPPDCAIPCQCGSSGCRGWIIDEEQLSTIIHESIE